MFTDPVYNKQPPGTLEQVCKFSVHPLIWLRSENVSNQGISSGVAASLLPHTLCFVTIKVCFCSFPAVK